MQQTPDARAGAGDAGAGRSLGPGGTIRPLVASAARRGLRHRVHLPSITCIHWLTSRRTRTSGSRVPSSSRPPGTVASIAARMRWRRAIAAAPTRAAAASRARHPPHCTPTRKRSPPSSSWRSGAEAPLARALQEAPAFVMAHVLQAWQLLCSRDPRRVGSARPCSRAPPACRPMRASGCTWRRSPACSATTTKARRRASASCCARIRAMRSRCRRRMRSTTSPATRAA